MRRLLPLLVLLLGCPGGPDDDGRDDDDDVGADDDDTVDDDDLGDDDDDSAAGDDDDSVFGPCTNDEWEGNDALEDAAPGPESRTRRQDLMICHGDEDWWRYDLQAGDVLTVKLFFDGLDGDIDLELLDPDGVLLAESFTGTSDELAWATATQTGPHYARVTFFEDKGEGGVPYDLGGKTCWDDEFEDNDTEGNAAPVGVPISLLDLGTCATDEEDWFVLQGVQAGQLIDVRLIHNETDGNLDVALFDPDGAVVAEGANTHHVETALHYATESGDFVLRVHLAEEEGGPGTFYDLDAEVGQPPGGCDDPFEPDDTVAEATPITATLYENFALCEGDFDHFSFPAFAEDEVELWLDFNDAEGDLNLVVLGPDGSEVASATSTDDDEDLIFLAPVDGTYIARVSLDEDEGGLLGNLYNLRLTGPTQMPCVPDLWEPNDSPEAANPIGNGDWLDQTICPGEDDFYELSLTALETLEVNVGSWHFFEGNMDVYLLDESGAVVASSEQTFGNERFFHTVQATGTYYLQVSLVEDEGIIEGQIYDFGVLSLIQETCPPDVWEPNDTLDSAAYVFPGPLPGAAVCVGEPDAYAFDVADGQLVEFDLVYEGADGELQATLYDETWTPQATSSPTAFGDTLSATAGSSGLWVVEVTMLNDFGPPGIEYDGDLGLQ